LAFPSTSHPAIQKNFTKKESLQTKSLKMPNIRAELEESAQAEKQLTSKAKARANSKIEDIYDEVSALTGLQTTEGKLAACRNQRAVEETHNLRIPVCEIIISTEKEYRNEKVSEEVYFITAISDPYAFTQKSRNLVAGKSFKKSVGRCGVFGGERPFRLVEAAAEHSAPTQKYKADAPLSSKEEVVDSLREFLQPIVKV